MNLVPLGHTGSGRRCFGRAWLKKSGERWRKSEIYGALDNICRDLKVVYACI